MKAGVKDAGKDCRAIPSLGRFFPFAAAAALHLVLLFGLTFTLKPAAGRTGRTPPPVMKLADIREALNPPLPSSVPVRPASSGTAAKMTAGTRGEIAAETFVENDVLLTGIEGGAVSTVEDPEDFLPMHLVSRLPRFSPEELRRRQSYPPPARRAGIEGTVYLEIFVDRRGLVRRVSILKEDPPGRGFGEAAARIFEGLEGSPALLNGRETAVRYRYPIRFSLE